MNNPIEASKITAVKKLVNPATHNIVIIWPMDRAIPPPLILAEIRPRIMIIIRTNTETIILKRKMFSSTTVLSSKTGRPKPPANSGIPPTSVSTNP